MELLLKEKIVAALDPGSKRPVGELHWEAQHILNTIPLISAAPELLSLLEDIADNYAECGYCVGDFPEDGEDAFLHSKDCLLAALIRKAKGE